MGRGISNGRRVVFFSLGLAMILAVPPAPLARFEMPGIAAPDPRRIYQAIDLASKYAAQILIDDEGKSRCDYDLIAKKWHNYEPAWHTGQIIEALLESYSVTRNEDLITVAKRAGDWWISLMITDHPKLKGMLRASHGDDFGDVIWFTTLSDGTPGLYRLSRFTGDSKYARTATRAGDWVLAHTWIPESGMIYDQVELATGKVLKDVPHPVRPNIEGSLFLDMYETTGEPRYRDAARKICDTTIEHQDSRGIWMGFQPNLSESGYIHPRFNLWYAEALIRCYREFKSNVYLEAAIKTAKTYAAAQLPDGRLDFKDSEGKSSWKDLESGSPIAFAGMVWMELMEIRPELDFQENVERSVHWLLENQYPVNFEDPNVAGAFRDAKIRKKKGVHLQRDVGTSFGLRFLSRYYRTI